MRIAIVDDELQCRKDLKEVITKTLPSHGIDVECVDLYASSGAFLDVWKPDDYQVIFLDIYIDDRNGVEIARKIRERDGDTSIIFCTTSNEFAAQSYEVDASYYLQKPLTDQKVIDMMKRVNFVRLEKQQMITLPDGYRCILHSISYTNYINHNVIFYCQGNEPHAVYMSHMDAEKLLLMHPEFCTVNKGNIVNMAMVECLLKNAFQMQTGELIPISRRRYKEVAQKFSAFKLQQMRNGIGA